MLIGKDPDKLLLKSSNLSRSGLLNIIAGIVPISKLLKNEINVNFSNLPSSEGIDPVILLDSSLISDKLNIIPISVGIVPRKEL